MEFRKTITRYVTVARKRLQLIERLRESDHRKDEALEELLVVNSELDRRVLDRTRIADKRATQLRALASEPRWPRTGSSRISPPICTIPWRSI